MTRKRRAFFPPSKMIGAGATVNECMGSHATEVDVSNGSDPPSFWDSSIYIWPASGEEVHRAHIQAINYWGFFFDSTVVTLKIKKPTENPGLYFTVLGRQARKLQSSSSCLPFPKQGKRYVLVPRFVGSLGHSPTKPRREMEPYFIWSDIVWRMSQPGSSPHA